MRPLTLEMHAFGPYARSQTLDFRELGDRPLFLIHGPTGSGKSTILDAICFALYGETSGKERDGGQMRSDHAPADLRTRVVYEFAIGDRVYRIDRNPTYDVLRDDGETSRTIQHKVQMWERSTHDDAERLIGSKVGEVGEQVERLLGLRADQFRQVVVLPQGRFRELLTASSNERERIFSTLFQTDHYRVIQDRLKKRAREIEHELEQQRQRQRTILETAQAESLDALNTKLAEIEEEIARLTAQRSKQEQVEKDARTALETARESDRKLKDVEQAKERVTELDGQREAIDQERSQLDLARKAATLTDAEANLDRRIKEAEQSEETRDELQDTVNEATDRLTCAQTAKEQADELQTEIERLTGQKRELEGYRPRIEALKSAEKALADTMAGVEEKQAELEKARAQHREQSNQLEQEQQHLTTARLQAGQVDGLSAQLADLDRRVRQRGLLDTRQDELNKKLEEQETAATALETATHRLKQEEETLSVLDAAWRQGQAAVLARQLEEDQPCPVCGSIHHPVPAESDETIPTEEQLKRHRETVQTARDNRDKASNNKIKLEEQVTGLQGEVDGLKDDLGDDVYTPLANLQQQKGEVERRRTTAETEAAKVDGFDQHITGLGQNVQRLDEEVRRLTAEVSSATSASVAAQTSYDNALRELPEEYRSTEALEAAIESVGARIEELGRQVQSAETELREAKSAYERLSTQLESAMEKAREDREQADGEATSFEQRLQEQGFADREAYQAARLAQDEVDRLNQQINDFDTAVSNAQYWLRTAIQNAEGLSKPDLDTLEQAVTDAENETTRLVQALGQRSSERDTLTHARDQLNDIARQIDDLYKQYNVAEYLSSVANGEAAYSRHRVSFERFVLSAFLDEVLDYATHRLYGMTNGRFRLIRKTEGGDRRRSTGLDLEVEDAYTGTARDVSTLSGGEGFLAALSMALGLSEVVQNRAGGIHLQTLFVDEGFGSLDPDALDRSLKTLVDVHHGRLVGIISHVPELQERIDVRLSVEAGKSGSHASFVV